MIKDIFFRLSQPKLVEIERKMAILEQSIDWWEKEMEKIFNEIERIEQNPYAPDFNKKMELAYKKLDFWVKRGDFEMELLANLQKEFGMIPAPKIKT